MVWTVNHKEDFLMHKSHDSGVPFGPRLPASLLRDKIRVLTGGSGQAAAKAALIDQTPWQPTTSKAQPQLLSAADDSRVALTSQPGLSESGGTAPGADPDLKEWDDSPERKETPYTIYAQALSAAREADVAMAEASDALDRSSHVFLATVARFVEEFDTSGFELDNAALDAFLDEQGAPPLHGNAATPLLRVMQAFKTEGTKASLVGKRATALAGLRLAKVSANRVEEALGRAANEARAGRGKGGMDHYIALYRKERRNASPATVEAVETTDQLETEAAGSDEPQSEVVEQAAVAANPSWIHEIEEMVGHGNVVVLVDDRVLPITGIKTAGAKITLQASSPSGF
ncbi:hypothetical protein MKL11_24745 [Methylobacterium sp. J-077]|nr:hypothetical protein [Methylobacterium sp. J-077]